jgi:hypothetical protein
MSNACQDATVIAQNISQSNDFQAFQQAVASLGGLYQITSSGNFHLNDWNAFKDAVSNGTISHQQSIQHTCHYNVGSDTKGIISVILNRNS